MVEDVEKSLKYEIISTDVSFTYYSRPVKKIDYHSSLKFQRVFQIQETMFVEGSFSIIIFYENELVAREREVYVGLNQITVRKNKCSEPGAFRCPQNFNVCTKDFKECMMIDKDCVAKDQSQPFSC